MTSVKLAVETIEVASRLEALGLRHEDLLYAVGRAVGGRNDAVPFDPINASGMLAYIFGTRAIRERLVPKGWRLERYKNIEATVNPASGVSIIYQNCDCCSVRHREPRAIAGKGAAVEQMVDLAQGDLFPELLDERMASKNTTVWFLCVSVNGDDVRAELSCPKSIDRNNFGAFHERIFVAQGSDSLLSTFEDDVLEYDDIEVTITRK